MQVGDLVKYRRIAVDAGVGIIIKKGEYMYEWLVLWSNGASETLPERNLRLINESR